MRTRCTQSRLAHATALLAVMLLCATSVLACSDQNTVSAGTNQAPVTDGSGRTVVALAAPPKKVTIAGDSISVGLGVSLRKAVDADVNVKVIGQEGSGLARPDDFNWPERLRKLAQDFPPQVLVLSLSSNDSQDLTDAKGNRVVSYSQTEKWDQEYSNRLAQSFDAFKGSGTTVLWVGHVRTQRDKVGLTNRHIQQLATQAAATRPWVVVQDLATLLGTGDQVAKDCLVADGLHLKPACLDQAAAALTAVPPIG